MDIKKVLEETGWSKKALAERLRVNQSTISQYMNRDELSPAIKDRLYVALIKQKERIQTLIDHE